MPHQTFPEKANLSPSASEATNSPASLLWAHQLRREHKILVSRIDQLEDRLKTTTEATETKVGPVPAQLDGLETRVGELAGENEEFRGAIEALKEWRECEKVEGPRKEKEKMEEWEETLKEEIGKEVSRLEGIVKELKEEVERRGSYFAASGVRVPREQEYGTPPSAQPLPQGSRVKGLTGIPSTVSGTPTTTRQNSEERQSFHLFVSESCRQLSGQSSIGKGEASPILGNSPEAPAVDAITSDSQNLLATLRQEDRSVSAYLELGKSVLMKFPRRRDESKVVEAFWEGLTDSRVRNLVEERLDADGWTWNVLREAVHTSEPQEVAPKPSGQGQQERKPKKRRVIPLVWSVEEDDDWLYNFKNAV